MFPISDGVPAKRFPLVNVVLIDANFVVWPFYELPHLDASVDHASFYPCSMSGARHGPLPGGELVHSNVHAPQLGSRRQQRAVRHLR